ncbi:MAG: hypothetical protein C0425_01655 [Chlorobiaceae bacterium]|nr:hypothetical protein [Chlorobiaceae bacterium]MBA4309024.1 hypothetical protein [Chlorobiaceae bacterium]
MSNSVIGHIEIPTTDIEASAKFYLETLGWDFKPFGKGYYLCNTHKGTTLGLRSVEKILTGDTTIFHFLVQNIQDTLAVIENKGGKVVRTRTVIPVYGWYALFEDNVGNTIGLYQTH